MALLAYVSAFLGAILVALTIAFRRRRRLGQIRGPSGNFWWGHASGFARQTNVGDLDFQWNSEYGNAWRIGGVMGEDILMLSDPKVDIAHDVAQHSPDHYDFLQALQHIFHKSGYHYPKHIEANTMSRVITGRGILYAHGTSHQRHRKVMNPAFTAQQLRTFLPLFRRASTKMCQQWKDEVLADAPKGSTVMVNKWLARLTLDVIGEAAFDFEFGALDNASNEVSQAYNDMFIDSVMHPSKWNTLFRASWKYLPTFVLDFVDYIPTREYKRFRHTTKVINKVSKQLIEEKTEALLSGGQTSKDVMSILVRANVSENPKTRLNAEEMIAQMSTLTLAGHETTANTLTWYLWELAKHPEFQTKLREEIMAVRANISTRGDSDLTIDDLDSMPLLQAGMKETLRYHSIVYHLLRTADQDDVIPLSSPIYTKKGQMMTEIPIKAGQNILVSVCAYNRLTDVWGKDAHEWNPMRFLNDDSEKQVKIGVYSNLMSFSAGLRGCIGWRFSVIEMQAIMFDLVENFKFTLPEEKLEILRLPAGLMGPLIKEKPQEGLAMPLRIVPL
ncbi:hypothetical protein EIP86_002590 [Pleurotus ostreatoroseus]|nr:hypothetical protein EIP86_002590 [Pleurotus ostreatoroseus]